VPRTASPPPGRPEHSSGLTPGFFSHPLGTTGFEAGEDVWRKVVAQFPDMRVVAEDILVDKVAIRSSVQRIATPDGGAQPLSLTGRRSAERNEAVFGRRSGPNHQGNRPIARC
jgi:hypothetical protein